MNFLQRAEVESLLNNGFRFVDEHDAFTSPGPIVMFKLGVFISVDENGATRKVGGSAVDTPYQ